ncbi:class I SAM-dependent methyltransferase [Candidatus Thioglobus sp.]|nr:class I SAM-dependent methyltransferase [Candidatus Thioglobus sp.]
MKLVDYQNIWKTKKVLRFIYDDFYKTINEHCINGNILEIGGGIGNFNIEGRDVIRTDIQLSKTISLVADAHKLPFSNSSFSNIILIDVLHHLDCPVNFLKEASRVLTPQGRLIMIEPGITPISWLFYNFLHEEEVDLSWKPSNKCTPKANKDPYEANQAIPTLLFNKYYLILSDLKLSLISNKWMSLFVYPLSGGFKKWSLVPSFLVNFLLRIEKKLIPLLGPLMAFRMVVVVKNTKKI